MARNLLLGTALQTGLTFMAALAALPAHAQPAPTARPTGGSVVAGSAAISRSASNTQINQSSQRAAIDWKSFDIGNQQTVTFSQPSASAIALNRVTGPDPSQIAGRIDANGQIILVNQSGVNFYKGAQVNAAGVMISAANVSNANFMAGTLKFDQPGAADAKIDNQGNITVSQAGLAALVAPRVANSGTITAQLGHVVLAGAKTATLDLYGDGLLSLDVTNQVTQAPTGKDALVTNTGVIIADGGTVQLTARAADGIVQTLVQAGGTIRAATMGGHSGTVALNGVGGSIVVEGQLSAPGSAPGTQGGAVDVAASGDIVVASGAKIDASGQAGGGVVALGTTLARARGGPSVPSALTAANLTVRKGATIAANATSKGDGGRITLLSGNTTVMDGTIAATGGPAGGNGGFVEVSGGVLGTTTGMIDVSAPSGRLGTILFDPRDLDIVTAGTGDGNVTSTGVPVGNPDQNTDITVSASVLTKLTGNLLIEASRNLTVDAGLSFTNQVAGDSVTLLAGNNLFVNQPIATGGGSLTLSAAVATDGTTKFANFNPGGALVIGANVGGGATGPITLSAGSGGMTLNANVTGPTVTLNTTGFGNVFQTGGALTTSTLTGDVGGGAFLTQSGNAVATLGNFTSAFGFNLTNSVPLSVTGTLNATENASLSTTAGAITEAPGGSIITALFNASTTGAGGDILLTSTSNKITRSNGITATNGDIVLVDGQDLTLVGTYSANNLFFEVASKGGTLTLSDFDPSSDFPNPVSLTAANGGRASLVADNYVIEPNGETGLVDATITAGTVELAPYSLINASLLGASGLVIDSTMLSIIQTNGGTLDVGGYTNVLVGATTPAASAGSVTIDNAVNLTAIASTLRLDSNSTITQAAGAVLTVGTLIGTAVTDADLGTNPNAVGTLGSFTVSGGPFTIDDGGIAGGLTVNGPVTGTDVTIRNAPTINVAGSIGASATVAITSGVGGIGVGNGGAITGSTIDLNGSSGGIALTGNASVGNAGAVVDLTTAGGGVTEAATATITAGTLQSTGGIAGAVALPGAANAIAAIGSLAVTGGTFSLVDTGNLSVAGALSANAIGIVDTGALAVSGSALAANAVNLTADSIAIPGNVSGTSVALFGTVGAIGETGSLNAGVLSGSAIGAASLIGTNQVAALGNFSAASFALNDTTGLLLAGTLNAARIRILDPAGRITLGNGATIVTGGTVRPPGPLQPALEPANGAPGALLQATSFVQLGSSTVLGQGGGPATLQISTTAGDQFDPPLGLQATGTWLILDLASGTAAGSVFVRALDVTYTAPGGTNLFGTIAGITGGAAASFGFIQPAINANYLFNRCVIETVKCSVISLNTGLTATLGAIYPLITGAPPSLAKLPDILLVALPMLQPQPPQLTDPDVVPPNISYLDY
jgi:filamentous hemagglutinin family protein